MPTGLIGYDPVRIWELDRRARLAVDHLLRTSAADDPLADPAVSVTRRARAHLEHDWLPMLARIGASTSMTEFGTTSPVPMALRTAPRGEESGPPASNSLESELNPSYTSSDSTPRAPITTATLDGWTYTCGPVSAATGQPASGCEWMPPRQLDMSGVILALSFAPITGEIIDAYDCLRGDIPCELIAVPGVSGRAVNAAEELLTGGSRAVDVMRLPAPNVLDSWARPDTLEDHFLRHGPDLGSTSAEHYIQQALDFRARAVTENLPTKIDPDTGIIRFRDPSTDEFAVFNPDGTIASYYVLDPAKHAYGTNDEYWNTSEDDRGCELHLSRVRLPTPHRPTLGRGLTLLRDLQVLRHRVRVRGLHLRRSQRPRGETP